MTTDKYVNMRLLYCKRLPDSICVIIKYLLFYCQCIHCLESEPKYKTTKKSSASLTVVNALFNAVSESRFKYHSLNLPENHRTFCWTITPRQTVM